MSDAPNSVTTPAAKGIPDSEPMPCETCHDVPEVCATVPGLRHCEAANRESPSASAPSEIEQGRAAQAAAVMPLIGNLLDHWDSVPNDLKEYEGLENVRRAIGDINAAMESAPTPPTSGLNELLDELEGIQAGYEMAGADECRRLDAERIACRRKIESLFARSATAMPEGKVADKEGE